MFYNNPNVEKISDNIYVYRNFIKKDRLDKIHGIIKDLEEQNLERKINSHNIDWYADKFSPAIPELYDVWCDMNELLLPEYCIHPQISLIVTKEGEEMYVHADSPGEDMEDELIASDIWNTCCVIHYGAIVYFGEWEGGEVYYPNINSEGKFIGNFEPYNNDSELRVKPNAGDLVIHGSLSAETHGVKKITSGSRYAFSNFVLPVSKNPGTFPIYGTKENEERWSKGWREWITPQNFVWQPSQKLQEEIDQGITSVRYRNTGN